MALNFIQLVMAPMIFISVPKIQEITTYSDKSERGGATVAEFMESTQPNGIRARGVLKGIIGAEGQRVGFVGIRFPIGLRESDNDLFVRVTGTKDLLLRAVFKTKDQTVDGVAGNLTYQVLLEATEAPLMFKINTNQLKPVIRGRDIDPSLAPPFRLSNVQTFGLELMLSEQVDIPEDGKPFDLIFHSENNEP
jgi:Complex I intermediate-associated protein 30 (CIA30)